MVRPDHEVGVGLRSVLGVQRLTHSRADVALGGRLFDQRIGNLNEVLITVNVARNLNEHVVEHDPNKGRIRTQAIRSRLRYERWLTLRTANLRIANLEVEEILKPALRIRVRRGNA
jgi:hypothetical protein